MNVLLSWLVRALTLVENTSAEKRITPVRIQRSLRYIMAHERSVARATSQLRLYVSSCSNLCRRFSRETTSSGASAPILSWSNPDLSSPRLRKFASPATPPVASAGSDREDPGLIEPPPPMRSVLCVEL